VAESTRNSCCRGRIRGQVDGRCLSELDTWVTRFQTQTISCGVCGEQSSSETELLSMVLIQTCHPWLWYRLVIRGSETGLSSVALRQACHPWLWDRPVIRGSETGLSSGYSTFPLLMPSSTAPYSFIHHRHYVTLASDSVVKWNTSPCSNLCIKCWELFRT